MSTKTGECLAWWLHAQLNSMPLERFVGCDYYAMLSHYVDV